MGPFPGVFTPLKVMYPEADVPIVQLSLDRNRGGADPAKQTYSDRLMGKAVSAFQFG